MFWAECAVFFHRNVSAYHFLHNCVADIYADLLKSDIEFLNLGEVEKISLAAKWCPSVNSFYDRRTQICESIAKAVFPFEKGSLKNCLAVYGISRDMNKMQKDICVSMGLLVSELSEEPVSACLWGMWGSYRRRRECTTLPEIVFWNLRGETGILNFPARSLNRVTMVNGFSNDSLAALLERDVVPTLEDLMRSIGPDNVLKSTISGDLYDNLLV
ncbi:hypothetical protein NC651_022492 [Populus alba x Populus x berolinensis]|nr:hypothetical protein NC651_022466 [Populus alba x Populus x berolinensis]KAJ6896264.1 hypothetical protein NC651_022473 [Populus alba x Populus x berolinensis]KAJ6896279.1 hypothetical protein NC651_022482 [Populus alba x Populus x berolinensis]KAJ6896292.1 hypothetical protein NC651_022492 [Populus alba x Populus x berolinensis]